MTMKKLNRRRLRNSRPKAFAGEAIVAAGIGAGATIAGAAMNAAATKAAAQRQVEAARQAAQQQADALDKQNEVSIQNQEKQINFTRTQNERNRDLQKEIQMNLQLLAGQQNETERLEATKIQVKNGGSMRKRLRNAKTNATSLLQGMYDNLPFEVTDGGGVIPLGVTPEGYELYEIVGNDHEHYHKTQSGKNKTGVGIKFNGTQTIEGEGNQNSNQGELMLVTPTDAKFISKHSIKGYNPAQAVLAGQDPLDAFAIQEQIKEVYGINDDGTKRTTSPLRRKRYIGGNTNIVITPDLSLDYLAPVATGVVAGSRKLRCGGRRKAAYGFNFGRPPYGSLDWLSTKGDYTLYNYPNVTEPFDWTNPEIYNYTTPTSLNATSTPTITRPTLNTEIFSLNPTNSSNSTSTRTKGLTTAQGNFIGAGISAAGNLLAAGIGTIGNTIAARNLARGYDEAGRILADAYGNLRTVDMNSLRRRDFRGAHAMAAVRAPYVNTAPELALIDRSLQRRETAIRRNSLSGAAALNRLGRAEMDAYDMRSQVFANAERQREAIRQANAERITQVANENANRDVQANNAYANAYLGLLQYNNDIENERITGVAQSRADAIAQRASTLANMRVANAQAFADAINVGSNAFASTFATNAKMRNELEMSRYGWTAENNLNWVIGNGNLEEARILYKRYKDRPGQYSIWAQQLEDAFGKQNLI